MQPHHTTQHKLALFFICMYVQSTYICLYMKEKIKKQMNSKKWTHHKTQRRIDFCFCAFFPIPFCMHMFSCQQLEEEEGEGAQCPTLTTAAMPITLLEFCTTVLEPKLAAALEGSKMCPTINCAYQIVNVRVLKQ